MRVSLMNSSKNIKGLYLTLRIYTFILHFRRAGNPDTRKEGGFPESAYKVSKAAEIALTMLYHRRYKNLIVNACCPGFVATNMTSYKGYLKIEQGADTPVYLAVNDDTPNGEFVQQRKISTW